MRIRSLIIFILFLSLIAISGCKCARQDNRSSKQGDIEKESFDLSKFESSREIQKKVFETRFSEIARRFGDAIFEQTYSLEISSGKQKIEFQNKDLIEQAKNGDYHIRVENSADKIMEVYYIDKKLYVSADGKKYFLHSDDLMEARAKRESVYAQANSFLKSYAHFIKFKADGEEDRDGVKFFRYKTDIEPKPDKGEGERYYSLEEINGYILLDKRSGGVVAVDIRGVIKYERDSKAALTKFSIKSGVKKSPVPLIFKAPEVSKEPQKLRIEKDLLERLEKMEEKVDSKEEEEE